MARRIKSTIWDEHLHTARAVTGAVVAIATGIGAQHTSLTDLGLQSVLEMIWRRTQEPEPDETVPAA